MPIDHSYDREPDLANMADAERSAWWLAYAAAAVGIGLAQRHYERTTILGKPLDAGTLAPPLEVGEGLRTEQRRSE